MRTKSISCNFFAWIDWSMQATVSWIPSNTFGIENVSIVAEEEVQTIDALGLALVRIAC